MSAVLGGEDLRLVDRRVRKFREEFGVRDAPVDGYRLLRKLFEME